MAIQIGKYKRPGIFIEEYDNSIITSPAAGNETNILIVGFSKKGPINTPVRLTNTGDLDSIFGTLDRGLERKGSFFHRTIAKMLASSPVYALNLLATDDDLDTIEYKSLSAATDKSNGSTLTDSYRKFFNTTGFWKRDTDAFITLTKDDASYNNVILNLTNLSDRPVSVFMFKSKLSGFDRTLIEWYGTAEKVPPYLSVNEYASDYMVDAIVVGGDWSNYSVLSVDPRWSRYFDASGLKKSMIRDFANDRNVNLLAYYEGMSLIPYFRDGNGKNIFIESIINRDTDKTGLFCAFNIDLFETDYPKGMVDLIGNNLVGSENSTIEFLSYKDTINEVYSYLNKYLDRPGNTWALIGTYSALRGSSPSGSRDAVFAEGYIGGVSATASSTSSSITMTISINNGYAIIGGNEITVSTASTVFTVATSSFATLGATYTSTVVLRSTGVVEKVDGTTANVKPSVGTNDLVLGYSTYYLGSGGTFSNITYNNVYLNSTGFNELLHPTEYTVTATESNIIVEFLNTAATPSLREYEQYRRIKYFNYITSLLDSPSKNQMAVLTNVTTREKLSMAGVTVSNIVTSTLSNKSFQLSGLSEYSDVLNGLLVFYDIDDEFILASDTLSTTSSVATSTNGVAARYSDFYLDYLNGNINSNLGTASSASGDYFYTNFVSPGDEFDVTFEIGTTASFITLQSTDGAAAAGWPGVGFVAQNDKMIFPGSLLNKGIIEIKDYNNLGTTASMYKFEVVGDLVDEYLTSVSNIYDVNLKHYLKMFIDSNNNLQVEFVDSVGDSLPLTDPTIDEVSNDETGFDVFSNKLNYKQSLEIVYPTGYVPSYNKVLVNASRYTEVQIGDFLEAYVDISALRTGEVPRKLTRILSKKFYPSDTTLVEISCDARIATYNLGTLSNPDWQTTRYTTIEDYASTYKAITLSGFRVRQASMPDGTEDRQTEILNLVAAGTPMFNALTNKEAIDFRYVVDSFGLGLIEKSKQQLVDICGSRLDCVGFINMPSMKQFKNSGNPSFTNSEGVLDSSFIAKGADSENNPIFYYSFGEGRGTTCVGYFLPYLKVSDNGRPLDLPPAMFAATTYLKKHNSNITSIVPWTIAAGVTNGKVTGFDNVEMDFSLLDIENFNQAQMNPIVYKRNRGFVIETENTAQTLYRSALSYLHVREVLVELERELSRMLLDFQWKFNTPDVRAEIKLRADVICEQYVNKNGLYNYFNKCDDENNTPDIIDNQIGVLDTYVEPIKGMGIIVNNVTILRTGAIQSGGFING